MGYQVAEKQPGKLLLEKKDSSKGRLFPFLIDLLSNSNIDFQNKL